MKTKILGTVAVGAVALAGWATSAGAAEPRVSNEQPRQIRTAGGLIIDSEPQYRMVTGSNIPQRVRLRSIGTDSSQNVRIFTQRELQTINGGFGVTGIALDPAVTISGR